MVNFDHEDLMKLDVNNINMENIWKTKCSIILSMANSKKGLNKKISARKCTIVEVAPEQANKNLEEWHLYGASVSSKFIGLMYDNELVIVMGFSEYANKVFMFERLASKSYVTVMGGASKLFKHFEKEYNPITVYTYGADLPFLSNRLTTVLEFKESKKMGNLVLYKKQYKGCL